MKWILQIAAACHNQPVSLPLTILSINSVGSVSLSDNNSVSTLAAQITGGSANNFTYVNNPASLLTIGTVDGISGITTSAGNGNISVTNNNNGGLTVAQNVSSGTGSITLATGSANQLLTITGNVAGFGGITYTSDNMTLTGSTTAGASNVTVQPYAPATAISLGASATNGTGTLGLTSTELQTISVTSPNLLTIGSNSNTGGITVSSALDLLATDRVALTTNGIVTISHDIGDTHAPLSLIITGTGGIKLGANTTATTGHSTIFNNPVTLTANSIVTDGYEVIFESTVDAASGLTVNSPTTTFDGNVGFTTPLASLATSGSGNVVFAGSLSVVNTSGAQTFSQPAVVTATPVTFTSSAGTITFGSTLDGASNLTLSSNTGTVLDGVVGGNTNLTSLTLEGGATDTIDTTAITTTGAQIYNDALTLSAANTTLDTTNSAVTFDSTVDGANALVVNAGSGIVTFDNKVGNGTALTSLTVTGPTSIDTTNIITSGAQTYNSAITLGANATLNSSSGNGAITFDSTIDGADTLTVNAGTGIVTFDNKVGNGTALSSLTVMGQPQLTQQILLLLAHKIIIAPLH